MVLTVKTFISLELFHKFCGYLTHSYQMTVYKRWLTGCLIVATYIYRSKANSLEWDAENVFVERSCKVALKQLVVKDSLGNDTADKLEVAEMVGVAV